jgi:hypothetical protein
MTEYDKEVLRYIEKTGLAPLFGAIIAIAYRKGVQDGHKQSGEKESSASSSDTTS